jgi:threonine/homoserine/homoserine lactone efflux protein
MPFDSLVQLALFALASLYTPGPNNIMLASSGARFGIRRTLPHALGVAFGFPLMLFPMALGLGAVFEQSPAFRDILRIVGAVVMLWIGWKVATAGRAQADETARPFTFLMAAGFQWINPKAWAMAIAVVGGYMLGRAPLLEALVCAGMFTALGLGSAFMWTGAGATIRRFLSSDVRIRLFNGMMGLLIAACAAFLFIDTTP